MEASALNHVGAEGLRGPTPLLRIQSDERLVALTRRGNQAAYEALVARYQSRLLAFCRHMLGSREDAEDVLQEVFAAAFNAMLGDERPLNVRPWLYRIARNRSLNHLRRAQAIGVDSMDVHLSEHGATTAEQGAQARGVPAAHGGRPGPARDAAHRAPAARDRRALLRADRRGDGDDGARHQVAARARARVAGRGGRGAAADLRGGPRGARRGGRGAVPDNGAGSPPPAWLRPLRRLPQAAARHEQGARGDAAGRATAAAEETRAGPPGHDGQRRRRRRGRRSGRCGRRRRDVERPQRRRVEGRGQPGRRRDRDHRRHRGRPGAPSPARAGGRGRAGSRSRRRTGGARGRRLAGAAGHRRRDALGLGLVGQGRDVGGARRAPCPAPSHGPHGRRGQGQGGAPPPRAGPPPPPTRRRPPRAPPRPAPRRSRSPVPWPRPAASPRPPIRPRPRPPRRRAAPAASTPAPTRPRRPPRRPRPPRRRPRAIRRPRPSRRRARRRPPPAARDHHIGARPAAPGAVRPAVTGGALAPAPRRAPKPRELAAHPGRPTERSSSKQGARARSPAHRAPRRPAEQRRALLPDAVAELRVRLGAEEQHALGAVRAEHEHLGAHRTDLARGEVRRRRARAGPRAPRARSCEPAPTSASRPTPGRSRRSASMPAGAPPGSPAPRRSAHADVDGREVVEADLPVLAHGRSVPKPASAAASAAGLRPRRRRRAARHPSGRPGTSSSIPSRVSDSASATSRTRRP